MTKINLTQPIKRGDTTIDCVTLRKPEVGSLRGLKMTDILQMDVNAMSALLPRISDPALLPAEISAMDPADFMTLAARVVGFFLSPDQQAQIAATEHLH